MTARTGALRWVQNPQAGGRPIPPPVRRRVEDRLRSHAEQQFSGRYREFGVRFRAQFCYIEVYQDQPVPEGWPPPGWDETREELLERLRATPLHLCRLRYRGDEERWSFAFYSYASERYEPSAFATGDMLGSPEEALELAGAFHLA